MATEKPKQTAEYTKEQIASSEKYAGKSDLVNALLADGKKYTLASVDKEIDKFMKGKVKN